MHDKKSQSLGSRTGIPALWLSLARMHASKKEQKASFPPGPPPLSSLSAIGCPQWCRYAMYVRVLPHTSGGSVVAKVCAVQAPVEVPPGASAAAVSGMPDELSADRADQRPQELSPVPPCYPALIRCHAARAHDGICFTCTTSLMRSGGNEGEKCGLCLFCGRQGGSTSDRGPDES